VQTIFLVCDFSGAHTKTGSLMDEASKKVIQCSLSPSIVRKILNAGGSITQLSFFKPA
jgi:hypothetical protein